MSVQLDQSLVTRVQGILLTIQRIGATERYILSAVNADAAQLAAKLGIQEPGLSTIVVFISEDDRKCLAAEEKFGPLIDGNRKRELVGFRSGNAGEAFRTSANVTPFGFAANTPSTEHPASEFQR